MWEQIQPLVDPENKACCDSERTRLMKEWCSNQGYCIGSGIDHVQHSTISKCWCSLQKNLKEIPLYFKELTELEAVLKATHWVATEKGLL